MRVLFVHGACVRDGAWWWHRTAEVLADRGVDSVAAALPSCGETGSPVGPNGPGLHDDVEAVRLTLTASAEPTVLVAHSYGGVVAAQAIVGIDSVHHLLLVSSYLPEAGESLSSFGDGSPAPFLEIDAEAGTFGVRPAALVDTFLHDCPPGTGEEAMTRLAHQSLSVLGAPITEPGWRQVPTTYLVCSEDRGTPAAAQREFARRADNLVEMDTGHHPFLSQPDAVAELVRRLS